MRLHNYEPPVRAAAMYAIGTPEELAAATARAVERLQGDEHVDPLAAAYQAVIEAAGRRMVNSFSSQAVVTAAAFVPPDEDEVLNTERLAEEVAELAGEAQADAARVVMAELDAEGITFDVDTVFTEELLERIGANAALTLEGDLRTMYRSIIEVSAEKGWSVAEAAEAMRLNVKTLAPHTARAMARTELNGLANGGSLHVAQASLSKERPVYKSWLATDDERTREEHVEADGQTVPINDNFTVGGFPMPYPGYPFAPAELVINCRCTITYTSDPTGQQAVVTDPDAPPAPPPDPLADIKPSQKIIDTVEADYLEALGKLDQSLTPTEYKRQLEKKLADVMSQPSVKLRIRTTRDVAREVASDGRFQSQFESGGSMGMYDPDWRAKAEQRLFGYDLRTDPKERPIYGYVGGVTPETGSVQSYGEVAWELKDDIRQRTTFTAGDSLGEKYAPSPINRPSALSLNPGYDLGPFGSEDPDPLHGDMWGFQHSYREAQFHGGVTLDDVERVIVFYDHPSPAGYADPDLARQHAEGYRRRAEDTAERLRNALEAAGFDIEVVIEPYQGRPPLRGGGQFAGAASGELGLGLVEHGLEVGDRGLVPVAASDDAHGGHLVAEARPSAVEDAHPGVLQPVASTLGEQHEHVAALLTDDPHASDDTSVIGGSQPFDPLPCPARDHEEVLMSTTDTEQLADGEVQLLTPIAWDAVLCVEGEATEDGRLLERGSIGWRDLPLTLMGMLETAWGHDGAKVSGRIDSITRVVNDLASSGELTSEFGITELAPLIADRTVRGVSIDLAVLDYEIRDAETGEALTPEQEFEKWLMGEPTLFVVLDGTIVGATVCPMPAIANAEIALAASAGLSTEGRALLAAAVEGRNISISDVPLIRVFTPFDRTAARSQLIAAAPLVELAPPPTSHFEIAEFPGNTPLTVTEPDETGWRRVFGHIATWDTCHVGIPGVCTTAPRSYTTPPYALFHQAQVEVAEGGMLDVGSLMLGTGHAGLSASRMEATKHYDNPAMVGARVRAHDGEHGIWVSGVVNDRITEAGLRELRENPPSGDWRGYNGRLELIAVCAVAVPGFPVVANAEANLTAAGGQIAIDALIASAGQITPSDVVKEAMIAAGCACDDVETDEGYIGDLADLALE